MSVRSLPSQIQFRLRVWLTESVSVNTRPSAPLQRIEWGVLHLALTLVLVGGGLFGFSGQAGAATVTVTSTTDVSDGNTSSISALIASPGADGVISLREAIAAANNTPGADTIAFNIPGGGLKTINPASLLPTITNPVTIDGYTQPGSSVNTLASGSNAVLNIQITPSLVFPSGGLWHALQLDADNCIVRGLIMNKWGASGDTFSLDRVFILVQGANAVIEGNFLGYNQAGTSVFGTYIGGETTFAVIVSGPNSGTAMIGGTVPAARNLIYASDAAVKFQNSSDNVASGNIIGLSASGGIVSDARGSARVSIYGGNNNTIGGTSAAAANLIGGGVTVGNDYVTNAPTVNGSLNNRILGNSYDNLRFAYAIRLDITTNSQVRDSSSRNILQDPLDADNGPNGLQNPPMIVSASTSGAVTSAKIRLTTKANQTYRVELYANDGVTFVSNFDLTTDTSGFAETTVNLPAIAVGTILNATATGLEGTSEFSTGQTVQDPTASGASLVVTNTNDSGAGSLRQAIINANARINGPTPDVITFNIPGAGVQTIAPLTAFPIILDPVTIDGYTQPGSSVNTLATGNNATLLIEVTGANNSTRATVFRLQASDTTLRGMVVNGSAGSGDSSGGAAIAVFGASNISIEGCFIGTNAAGTAAAPKPYSALTLDQVSNSVIGGSAAGSRNTISGNYAAIALRGNATTGNVISNNYIGTSASGMAAIPNLMPGIVFSSFAANNLIGGTTAAARNVISGNAGSGIGNDGFGGIQTLGGGNKVQGNYIGTTADGNSALGNNSGIGFSYIQLLETDLFTIGGTEPGAGNVISGNTNGILADGWNLSMPESLASGVVIQGNRIGTNAAATAAIPNMQSGIAHKELAPQFFIGGSTAAARNIISGNTGSGINASNFNRTVIQGNYVGTDVTGTLPLGNGDHGILSGGAFAQIGDPATPGSGNVIAFNTKNGIAVTGDVGNLISRNSIFSNGALGIDLGNNGVTPNDAGDPDTGPNNLQNFPLLTSVVFGAGGATIQGTLNSTANTAFRVEFFSNPACNPSGYGEGRTYVGFTTVTTNGSGNGSYSLTLPVPAGQAVITATATDPANSTSEFSACSSQNGSTTTVSTSSSTWFESPPACGPVGSSRSAQTMTTEEAIGPATIIIGDRDNGGTAFQVLSGWTNLNVNTHTEIFQCVAGAQTITFTNPGSKTLGAPPFVLSANGGASGNPVTFASHTDSVCSVSGSTVTLLTAGVCIIAADQAGNASYAAATQVMQSFAVNAVLGGVTAIPSLSEVGLLLLATLVGLLGMAMMTRSGEQNF